MHTVDGFEKWLINISINQTAVRNHGVGIVAGIRYELSKKFDMDQFVTVLKSSNAEEFLNWVNTLTNWVIGKPGRDKNNNKTEDRIAWGAARKCINLLARSICLQRICLETARN